MNSDNKKKRVVVTGIGMVSPLGNTTEETWAGLIALRSLVPPAIQSTTQLQAAVVALTLLLALAVTVLAGLFPAWRASRTAGALRLKSL